MIQRIQSIYLLLAGIFPAITVFTPLVQFDKGDKWITLMGAGYDTVMLPEFAGVVPYGLWIFTLLSVLLPFIAIFGYKHRKKQMRTASLRLWPTSCGMVHWRLIRWLCRNAWEQLWASKLRHSSPCSPSWH